MNVPDQRTLLHRHYQHPTVRLRNHWAAARRLVTRTPLRLDLGEIHADAQAHMGGTLSDFGDAHYREGLARMVDSFNSEAELHPVGVHLVHRNLRSSLANRLALEAFRKHQPQAFAQPVARPLFILGLPRTGTTMLFQLLAADPSNRSPSWWELLIPIPTPRHTWEGGQDPRPGWAGFVLDEIHRLAPDLMKKHPTTLHGPEECFPLFMNSFANPMALYQWNVPSYQAWLYRQDMRPAYAYFREQLQALQHQRSGDRWLLKCPMHMAYLEPLLAEFPDARFVQLHRNPRNVIASACSLSSTFRGLTTARTDHRRLGRDLLDKLSRETNMCVEARGRLDGDRFIDIEYDELMRDPLGTVRRIYERFAIPFPESTLQAMKRHHEGHQKDKHGKHDYTLDDFGLDAQRVDRAFACYADFRPRMAA